MMIKIFTLNVQVKKYLILKSLRFRLWSHAHPRWPRPGSSHCGAKLVLQAGFNELKEVQVATDI